MSTDDISNLDNISDNPNADNIVIDVKNSADENVAQNISSADSSINSETMQRPVLNIDRLSHSRPNIPLLIGFVNNNWCGPQLSDWFNSVDAYFADEGITSDIEKLRAYIRFVSQKEGNVAYLVQSTPELRGAVSWESFKNDLSLVLNPLVSKSTFETFSDFVGTKWSPNHALPEFLTEAQRSLQSFIDSAAVSYTHLRAHETPEHLVCRLLL